MYQILFRSLIKGDKTTRQASPTVLTRTDDFKEALSKLKEVQNDFPNAYIVRTSDGAEWEDGLWIVYK